MSDGWWNLWYVKATLYGLFASFGGVMGHLMRAIDNGHSIIWWKAALEGAAAGFVGLLVLLMCQATEVGEQWTGVIVGVSGWLGANASIRLLESLIYQKLGLSPRRRREDWRQYRDPSDAEASAVIFDDEDSPRDRVCTDRAADIDERSGAGELDRKKQPSTFSRRDPP